MTLFEEIPFGRDSELIEESIAIPEGCYAFIEGNRIVIRRGKKPINENFVEFERQYMKDNEGEIVSVYDRHAGLVDGAEWQKQNDNLPVSEGLEEAARNHPSVIHIVSPQWSNEVENAFIAGANWQHKQLEKNRLAACDRQTVEEAEREMDFVIGIVDNEHRQPTFDDAIKYGMRIQRKQMMNDAVEGIAHPDDQEIWCNLKKFHLSEDDKIKLIIIKED